MRGCRRTRGSVRLSSCGKALTKYAGLAAIGAFAAIGFLHSPRDRAQQGRTREDEEDAKRLAERPSHMTAYDVEQGDKVHPGDPVIVSIATRRAPGSTIGSPRLASCCWRSPASRCSIRACSS